MGGCDETVAETTDRVAGEDASTPAFIRDAIAGRAPEGDG